MFRLLLRTLRAHTRRLVRTGLAVALGVAFVTGTFILTDTTEEAFLSAASRGSESVDLEVRTKSQFSGGNYTTSEREPIAESVVTKVAQVDGVRRAEGVVWGYAQVVDARGDAIQPMGPPTIGSAVGWTDEFVAGRKPTRDGEVALDETTAKKAGASLGDRVTLLFQGPAEEFELVGITSSELTLGATIATFELETAQRVLRRVGLVDSVRVEADQGVADDDLRQRVEAALPRTLEAVTSETTQKELEDTVDQTLGFLRDALLVFAGVGLFVGAFIIYNTFAILVAQRTREIGLLRAIGSDRRQIGTQVVAEAIAVSLVASLMGLAFGVLLAFGLLAMIRGAGMEIPTTTPVFMIRTAVIGLASGVVVTVVAAVAPARRAMRLAPVAALQGGGAADRAGPIARRLALGLAVVGLSAASLLSGLSGGFGSGAVFIGAGSIGVFVGLATLGPLIARPAARVLGAPLARVFGEPAVLGRQNAMRNPRRTASTAAALMIGLALVGFIAIMGSSLKVSISKTVDRAITADFVLAPKGMRGIATMSPEVASAVGEVPGVAVSSPIRTGGFGLDGQLNFLAAVDPDLAPQVANLQASTTEAIGRLDGLAVVVARGVADARGWQIGDKVTMTFARTGNEDFEIVGFVAPEDELVVGQWLVSLDAYEPRYTSAMDSQVLVKLEPGADIVKVRAGLEATLTGYPNVDLLDRSGVRERNEAQVDQFQAMMTAMLALSVIIAALGIANTLGLSIVERTRELGLLRAVGMTRHQLRAMIRWEAVITSGLGGAFGTILAIFFGWVFWYVLRDEGLSELRYPVSQLALFLLLAAVLGVVAAAAPARRASKVHILDALHSE